MNFYDMDAGAQRAASERRLLRFLREYVAPYHPFLRKLYGEAGIDPRRIRTMEDFRQLPLTEKKHFQSDPLMFILRPQLPGGPPLPPGYNCETLPNATMLRYAVTAALRSFRDPACQVRKESLRDRIRRVGMLEWLPIHTHFSTGSSGVPSPTTFTYWDIHNV